MLNYLNSYYANFFLFIFVSLINQLIMTSKEFQRKCAFYRPFSFAVALFSNSSFDGTVYRVTCMDSVGRKYECFTAQPDLLLYGDTKLSGFKYLYFDIYSLYQYSVDLRYFKTFVSELTQYQLDVLNADPSFNYLLNFISNE